MSKKLIRDGYAKRPMLPGFKIEKTIDPDMIDNFLELKAVEESKEFSDAIKLGKKSEIAEEAADVIEVILSRASLHRVSRQEVEEARIKKRKKLGGFENGVVLITED